MSKTATVNSKTSRSAVKVESKEQETQPSALPGVHVIGVQDSKKHFGTPETDMEPEANLSGSTEPERMAVVRVTIDAKIWLRAMKLSEKRKLTMNDYVEKAIDAFNNSPSSI